MDTCKKMSETAKIGEVNYWNKDAMKNMA